MSEQLERLDRWAARQVAWLDAFGVGPYLRAAAFLYLPLWAAALDSGFVPEGVLVRAAGYLLFGMLLVVGAALERHRNTAALTRLSTGLRGANASLAGALETLSVKLDRRVGRRRTRLGEADCKHLSVAFLARIRSLAYLALGVGEGEVRLRATLAIPLRDPGGAVRALRVWCYDQPYDDRRYTEMPMDWPGAPAAFRNGAVEIIEDLQELDLPVNQGRRFRSVICFPIRAGAGAPEPLGVVSIDADPRAFFDVDRTDRLNTYLQPAVQAIGLALISRTRDAPFTFE